MAVIVIAAGTGLGSSAPVTGTGASNLQSRAGADQPAGAEAAHPTGRSCRALRKAVRYYRAAYVGWRSRVGAGPHMRVKPSLPCPRYLAKLWRSKAHAAHVEYRRWHRYHYAWQKWLPRNWYLLGSCESGSGGDPNFQHSNGDFTSAFGISWAEYNTDAAYFGAPPWHVRHTPRDQYDAARGHLARFGDGWGCAGP